MASELSRLIESELTSQGFYKNAAKSKEQTCDDVESPHQVLNGKLRVEARVKEQQNQKTLLTFKRSICIGGGVLVVLVLCMVLAFKAKSAPSVVPAGPVASRTGAPPQESQGSLLPDLSKTMSSDSGSDTPAPSESLSDDTPPANESEKPTSDLNSVDGGNSATYEEDDYEEEWEEFEKELEEEEKEAEKNGTSEPYYGGAAEDYFFEAPPEVQPAAKSPPTSAPPPTYPPATNTSQSTANATKP